MKVYSSFFGLCCLVLIAMISLYSCASTGSPTGGKKDEIPPKLDSLRSTKNKQTNLNQRLFEFHFDEFVEVKDAIKQVLVSPPLTYIPQVKHKGKKVTFEFDKKEVLRENATYTINFGESIVDFHESNKLSNFTFVFSTGAVLDSLSLKGNIINALSREPEQDMVVFLYDNVEDSIVAKEKPFYFARTNKTGEFSFQNIKSDTFRLFAMKDENLNYKYDLPTEKIAFLDSLIYLEDTIVKSYKLVSSIPTPKTKLVSSNSKVYGKVNLLFNTNPKEITYQISDNEPITYKEIVNDSINIYYNTDIDSFFVYVLDDTLKVKPRGKTDFLKKSKFKREFANNSTQMLTGDSLMIGFNFPIDSFDVEKIEIEDTIGLLENVDIQISESRKNLIIKYNWLAGEKYFVSIDSNVIRNIYGMVNDSFGLTFSILTPTQTSTILGSIVDLDSTKTYVIKVFREKKLIYETVVNNVSETKINLKGLVPDKYNFEIIEDVNKNGKWDPGNYWQRTQPENIKTIKGDKLRENWESEVTISWKTGATVGSEPNKDESSLKNSIEQKLK
ncbi:MAG TPA: Ig-like domain-containing protein [Saprospiraceae bacterium]|nr:Ig-like domain-containing protein [Saprospiraceae bacterium]